MRGVTLLLLVAVVGGSFIWWQDQGSEGKDLAKIALEHVEVESADGTTQIHPLDEPEDQAVTAGQQPESAPLALEQAPAEGPPKPPARPPQPRQRQHQLLRLLRCSRHRPMLSRPPPLRRLWLR